MVAAAIATIDANVKSTFGAASSFGIDPVTHKLTLFMGTCPPARLPAPHDGALLLRARINGLQVRFEIETGSGWRQIGSPESLAGLSDEVGATLRFSDF